MEERYPTLDQLQVTATAYVPGASTSDLQTQAQRVVRPFLLLLLRLHRLGCGCPALCRGLVPLAKRECTARASRIVCPFSSPSQPAVVSIWHSRAVSLRVRPSPLVCALAMALRGMSGRTIDERKPGRAAPQAMMKCKEERRRRAGARSEQ